MGVVVAAPEVGFTAAVLLAVAGTFLLIGILSVAKSLVRALFAPLNIGIKYIGHPFGGIVNDVEASLLGWIDGAIAGLQTTTVDLLHSIAWVWEKTALAIERTATDVYDAYVHLDTVVIPHAIETAIKDVRNAAHNAAGGVTSLETRLANDVTNLEHEITSTLDKAENYADNAVSTAHRAISTEIHHAVSTAETTMGGLIGSSVDFLNGRIAMIEGSIASVVRPIVNQAVSSITLPTTETAQDVQHAISDAFTNALSESGSVENAINSAVSSAVATIKPVVTNITQGGTTIIEQTAGDVAGQISDAIAQAVAAGGTIDAEIHSQVSSAVNAAIAALPIPSIDLSGITTPIQDILDQIKSATLPQLATTVAGVATSVAVLEAEAGLDDPACRAKNKEICGTDPLQWTQMLAGLLPIGFDLSLEEIIDTGREVLSLIIAGGEELGI